MRRGAILALALVAAAAFFLFMGSWPDGMPRPEPFLLVVVPAAMRWGSGWGSLAGFAAGAVQASLAPGPAGGYLLLYLGLGWLVGLARHEGVILLLLVTAAATVALAVGWSGLSQWLGSEPTPTRLRAWLPGALAGNLLLVVPVMGWFRARDRRRRR